MLVFHTHALKKPFEPFFVQQLLLTELRAHANTRCMDDTRGFSLTKPLLLSDIKFLTC